MAKVGQQKDKDFDAIEPRITFNDMIEERRNHCIEICREAYSNKIFNSLLFNLLNLNYHL